MKVLRRVFALVLALGLALALAASSTPTARADSDPIWQWEGWFDCRQGTSTVSECAYDAVLKRVGFTGPDGCVVSSTRFCADIVTYEHDFIWKPIDTWEAAQALLKGYQEVTTNPDVLRSEFSTSFAQSLLTTAQTRVSTLFDPVTHEYVGPPPTPPVLKSFSKAPAPTISGTATVGKTLKVKVKSWSPKTTSRSYQWYRSGVAIEGATRSSYKLVGLDYKKKITVTVTGARDGYTSVVKTSKATKTVKAGTMPKGKVKVIGIKRVGKVLTAKTWKWAAGSVIHYQWYRNGKKVVGAVSKTYVLTPADRKARLVVRTWATKLGYKNTRSRTSARTSKVDWGRLTTATPVISGVSEVGQTLTATAGSWTPSTTTFSYQWYRNGKKIPGATQEIYLLTSVDAGSQIAVMVTGWADGYKPASRVSYTVIPTTPPDPTPTPTPEPSPSPTPTPSPSPSPTP